MNPKYAFTKIDYTCLPASRSMMTQNADSTPTRSEPLYPKKLEGSVVKCGIRHLTTDTRPTSLELSNPKL